MMVNTSVNEQISSDSINNYFKHLVNCFFKILPMKENNESSLHAYINSLQRELLGCKGFIPCLRDNALFFKLLCILQYFDDNPDCDLSVVRTDVFKSIELCNKLKSSIGQEELL